MPVFQNSDQLYLSLKTLFDRIQSQDPKATRAVSNSKLILRLKTNTPLSEIVINGRVNPPKITYGSTTLRPDVDLELPADALHGILMAELPLSKAIGSGQLKVRGPVIKTFVLQDIFHSGQALYPGILKELGIDGSQL